MLTTISLAISSRSVFSEQPNVIFIICDDPNGSRRAGPFFDITPQNRNDGIAVGELGRDDGDRDAVLKFAQELAKESTAPGACSFGAAAKKGNLCYGTGVEF